MNFDYSKEFQAMIDAYKKAGGNEKVLIDNKFGSIVINENKVLGKNEINGFHVKHESIKEIGKDAKVEFLAHCTFPNAKHIEHIMNSRVSIGVNGNMSYIEEHYHSESGGTLVYPKLRGEIKEGGKLSEEFRLTRGRVGILNIDYEIEQDERSACDLLTKVYGKKDDRIEVRESLHLNGEYAAGTAKSRIVLIDNAFGNVLGEIEGNAAYTRGHVDCHEVVHGKGARAASTPKISVENPLARVTHEAAIGRINKKELETLMARGLTEEEAVDIIVRGLLK